MPKSWKLLKYAPSSFAGINESMSLVVLFDTDDNIVSLSGDQATCKTSNMNCLKALLGGQLPENAMNSKDGTIKAAIEIELEDGRKIDASYSKDVFRLYVTQETNGKPMRSAVNSPKTFMQDLIGPLGVSPMFLKSMDGGKQVKWLRDMAQLTPDQVAMEQDIRTKSKDDFDSRTAINRDVKTQKAALLNSPYFDYDKPHNVFTPNAAYSRLMEDVKQGLGDADAINARFNAANARSNSKAQCVQLLENLRDQFLQKTNSTNAKRAEIERLQKELALEEAQMLELDARIKTGDAKVEELKDADVELERVRAELTNLHKFLDAKKLAEDHMWRSNQYAQKSDQSVKLTAKLDEWQIKQRQFIQAITPEVEGIEVRVKRTIDPAFEEEAYMAVHPDATAAQIKAHLASLDSGNEEGIFYKGVSVAALCESELWDLCLILWHYMKVQAIFIENINTLGSEAVERINWFAKNGMVFYSEMERGQKDLRITFQSKIPVTKDDAAI